MQSWLRTLPLVQDGEDYVRVTLENQNGSLLARPLPGKSGAVFSLVQADGMFCIPHSEEGKETGEEVEIILFLRRKT